MLCEICELYVDDIVIFGDSEDAFVANVIKVLERLREYNVVAKPSKVQLGLTKVEYVGRELSHDGTRMQDEKTRKVLD